MRKDKKNFEELPYESWAESPAPMQNRQQDRRLQCEECGQRHMRKAEMIVAAGTRTGESVGPRYTVHHRSQTDLAARYSEPSSLFANVQLWAYTLLFLIGGQFASKAFLYPDNWSWFVKILLYGAVGGLVCGIYYAILRFGFPAFYNRLTEDHAVAKQQAADYPFTWVCMNCGHTQVVRK